MNNCGCPKTGHWGVWFLEIFSPKLGKMIFIADGYAMFKNFRVMKNQNQIWISEINFFI